VHAAGVVDDRLLARETAEGLAAALAPKLAGAWNLHRALAGRAIDFHVLFSAAAAVLGPPGQAAYAAANAALDALAHTLRAAGCPAVSIGWGPWSGDDGMAGRLGARGAAAFEAQGLARLETAAALAALDAARGGGRAHLAILAVDWARFHGQFHGSRVPALLEGLRPAPAQAPRSAEPHAPWGTGDEDGLRARVAAEAAAVLGLAPGARLDPRAGFADLGMDSLMALELRNRLQRGLGRPLPVTIAFDYPTLDRLVAHLREQAGAPEPAPPSPPDAGAGAGLDQLGEAELAELLADELQQLAQERASHPSALKRGTP